MVTRSRAGLPAGSTLLQNRERGIPPGSFRKMSAGDQQKVLDAALARISHRAGRPDLGAEVYKNLTKGQ